MGTTSDMELSSGLTSAVGFTDDGVVVRCSGEDTLHSTEHCPMVAGLNVNVPDDKVLSSQPLAWDPTRRH